MLAEALDHHTPLPAIFALDVGRESFGIASRTRLAIAREGPIGEGDLAVLQQPGGFVMLKVAQICRDATARLEDAVGEVRRISLDNITGVVVGTLAPDGRVNMGAHFRPGRGALC